MYNPSFTILCPVLFGLGVQLEKSFGSKWLVNHLQRLGYSISYDEVLRYKHSAVETSRTLAEVVDDGIFCQHVADNVDHNLVTLTGKGTFHGMGVISISTCNIVNDLPVRRLKEKQKASTFSANKGIPIVNYDGRSVNGLLRLKFKTIANLAMVQTHPTELSYNSLWQFGSFNPRVQIGLVLCRALHAISMIFPLEKIAFRFSLLSI